MHRSPEKSCRAEALHVNPGFSAADSSGPLTEGGRNSHSICKHVLLSKQGSNITSLREAGERWDAFWRW